MRVDQKSQLSSSQVDQIVASTVKRAVQTSGTRASKLLSSFETTYYDYLDSILKNRFTHIEWLDDLKNTSKPFTDNK